MGKGRSHRELVEDAPSHPAWTQHRPGIDGETDVRRTPGKAASVQRREICRTSTSITPASAKPTGSSPRNMRGCSRYVTGWSAPLQNASSRPKSRFVPSARLVSEEREGRALGGGPASRASHLELLEQHREWNSRVVRTLREMALAYAAMLDAFLGRWREESG